MNIFDHDSFETIGSTKSSGLGGSAAPPAAVEGSSYSCETAVEGLCAPFSDCEGGTDVVFVAGEAGTETTVVVALSSVDASS